MRKMTDQDKSQIVDDLEMGMHYLGDGVYCDFLYIMNEGFHFIPEKKDWYHLTDVEAKAYEFPDDLEELDGYYEFWEKTHEDDKTR